MPAQILRHRRLSLTHSSWIVNRDDDDGHRRRVICDRFSFAFSRPVCKRPGVFPPRVSAPRVPRPGKVVWIRVRICCCCCSRAVCRLDGVQMPLDSQSMMSATPAAMRSDQTSTQHSPSPGTASAYIWCLTSLLRISNDKIIALEPIHKTVESIPNRRHVFVKKCLSISFRWSACSSNDYRECLSINLTDQSVKMNKYYLRFVQIIKRHAAAWYSTCEWHCDGQLDFC